MLPKEFKTGTIYTKNIVSEKYCLESTECNYRVSVSCIQKDSDDCDYYIKIFYINHPFHYNGWTLNSMTFHKSSEDNYPPIINIKEPNGHIICSMQIPVPFADIKANFEGLLENRLTETYSFIKYISQFRSFDDFKFAYRTHFSSVKDVMRYYVDYIQMKDRLPLNIRAQIESRIKDYFEEYISKN